MIIVGVLVAEVFVLSINMSNKESVKRLRKGRAWWSCESIMQCFCSKEQMRVEDMLKLSENLDGVHSMTDAVDIEEAESSLRETGALNYEVGFSCTLFNNFDCASFILLIPIFPHPCIALKRKMIRVFGTRALAELHGLPGIIASLEARAVLGKYEYQKGNIEAAVRVFEGIDVTSVTPRIKLTLAKIRDRPRRRSQGSSTPPMSLNSVNLLFEAMLLKAKSLQALGRFRGISSELTSLFVAVFRSYHDTMIDYAVDRIFYEICGL